MKKCLWPLLGLCFLATEGKAQVLKPAQFSYASSHLNPQVGDTLELAFQAHIDEDWFLYSSDFSRDLGPAVTTFSFTPHDSYLLLGEVVPLSPKKKYDELWEGEYTYFVDKADFRQKMLVKSLPLNVAGSILYQVCSLEDGKCIQLESDFTTADLLKREVEAVLETKEEDTLSVLEADAEPNLGSASASKKTLWGFFFLAFLGGLAALFTPCVFPLIPMTVSYFTQQGGWRRALLYGLWIVIIYACIGLLLAPFMGPATANALATHWFPNVLFFLVFLLFGCAFLGMFELTLPSSWVNFADKRSDKGGLVGVFFMALTLVLVTFSCTGPIVGSLLVQSAGGLFLKPMVGMLGYSLAFALPFSLFAIFPKGLSSLPKSGSWLNTVKVTLGFLELAFALKFLSVADQAYHWGLLDREVYLAFWIAIFLTLTLYLWGRLNLKENVAHLPVGRLILGIVSLSFVVYLIPGLFGAPLKALSGYLPPQSTLDFDLHSKSAYGSASSVSYLCDEQPKHSDLLHWPHQLQGYFDYDEALSCAKEKKKPLFIDFTGHGCVNCREMEVRVWSAPEVLKRLREDFVLLALYVDEKTTLPEEDWYTSPYDNRMKKTIGQQNADFQIRRFDNNAQPYYIILDPHNEELLLPPRGYDLSIPGFVSFLDQASKYLQN